LSEIDSKELERLERKAKADPDVPEEDSVISKEEETNYYKENIFNKEDYYLYRAVMYFYSGEFDKAINDFEHCSTIMH